MTDDEAPKMMLPDVTPINSQLGVSLLDWLESIEEHDPEVYARLAIQQETGEKQSNEDIVDMLMETQSPETTRNLLLAEYDKSSDETFRRRIEEYLMGFRDRGTRPDWGRNMRNTSSDPLFRRSKEEVFDQVWDAIKSRSRPRKEGYSRHGNKEGVHSQIRRSIHSPNIKDRRIDRSDSPRPGVRVPLNEKTLCSNSSCTNKLKHRMGTAESMIPKLCGRCNRIHGKVTNLDPSQLRPTFDMEKGKFRGYSKDNIGGRAERQGKARAWSQSRKVKRGRTRKRYARNKKRGNVRPRMRRQLGAGGSRKETKR